MRETRTFETHYNKDRISHMQYAIQQQASNTVKGSHFLGQDKLIRNADFVMNHVGLTAAHSYPKAADTLPLLALFLPLPSS